MILMIDSKNLVDQIDTLVKIEEYFLIHLY